MKVWAKRRREDGAVLGIPVPVVEGAMLLELVVVEVTLEGNRRPSKVARLQTIGTPRILAQLARPKLVRAQGWTLVLSGIEATRDESGHAREVAQTWVCKLFVPEKAVGFRVKELYRSGVALPKKLARESSGSRGLLAVADDYSNVLQRHATCAELRSHQISTFPKGRLIDCHIEWMSEESFELGGLLLREAFESRPEQLERGGWLIDIDLKERELSKSEARMLR
ncbi:hypothetical protein G3257_11620 [Janthinobacterium lividum]|uniref:hypothetical protein n=1 Tax=Janthinobacterium lividum TaxID=29581 RepID=UPI0015951919|nr:hypothetical protein [Janthinobacterium lividum]QKY02827.1 hypothetical protein G3257_11620 [Janthinobacterium lividum]